MAMDRREFLRSTGAAAAAATTASTVAATAAEPALATPALVTGLQELRVAMPWADGVAGPADQARRLGLSIATLSHGRYRLVPTFGVANGLAAVRAGDADIYFASEHDHLDAHRGFAYFAGLPGDCGLAPQQLQSWIGVGGGQALWDDLAGDLGVKPLLAGHTGSRSYLLATERIETMSALAGRKAAVQGLARDVARGLGLEPVPVPPAELAGAMERGDILAAEYGGAIASYALGLPRVAPYWAGTSINRNGTALTLGLRRSLWEGLGAADQALFAAAAAAELQQSLAEEEAHRQMLHPEPPAGRTWPLAAELSHAIGRVAEAVVAHAAGANAQTRRLNDSYAAFRRSHTGADEAAARTAAS
jgi:TRAP-type mannitol/chloroaromatic compound transport system substrate-binding protein